MSSAPDDPLAMFTSASWQCPVCDRPGDLHDERCLVLEIAQIARRRKDGNRRLVQTNGRLRERVEQDREWRREFLERAECAEAEVRRLREERDAAWTTQGRYFREALAAEAEVQRLREGLRDFAKHGTRFDTNPTRILPTDPVSMERDSWWASRAHAMDKAVRDRARALLSASPSDGSGAK